MEERSYILGTDKDELYRLGLQHQVWAQEARKGWNFAGFGNGQTILDLGCGPGYCTIELAYIAGNEGKVIGVDLSSNYIAHLERISNIQGLNISTINASFDEMKLEQESLDRVYCRWAMAWIPNPENILNKLFDACKPGARLVFHEYYDWAIFQSQPSFPGLMQGVRTIFQHFQESPGDINVGRRIPDMALDAGFKLIQQRPMAKLATSDSFIWQWPKTFLHIYLPKLASQGVISKKAVVSALSELDVLEKTPGASILCPQLVEIILEKI